MPLPKPSLDSRVFDQLVAEQRAQIPRLAPPWTDHNASDPGITLLELCAWLAEQNFYRLDRPDDASLRGFARLVLARMPLPAGVASTVVAIQHANAVGVPLPPRIALASASGPVFETTQALFASPAWLLALAAAPLGAQPVELAWPDPAQPGLDPFGAHPRTSAALWLWFDRALDAPGQTLSLHVWTAHWRDDADTRARLQAESLGLAERCAPSAHAVTSAAWQRHYRVQTIWEYHAGGGLWLPLDKVVDETRSLSLSGFVHFAAPAGHQALDGRWPLRCRIQRGRFECPPRLLDIAFNAVPAEHASSHAEQPLGVSRGHALARFPLGAAPVIAQTLALTLDDGAGDVQTDWQTVAHWDRCGPHDRCLRLDAERGVLQAGDGLRGAIPPTGYTLRASYRLGGGMDGNLDAGSLITVPANAANDALTQPTPLSALGAPLTVLQPVAATGGAEAEDLRLMQARAFDAATRVDKAVTLVDIERLALQTPGLPLARVHAVAGMHPLLPCMPMPGVVTLIVVPSCPRPAPVPSQALLDAVAQYLAPRRLVTSELHLVPPCYRRVAAYATLGLAHDADSAIVQRLALAALDRFLDPLDGGPEGGGWPIGRTVYRHEVMALLADVPGVASVSDLGFDAACADGGCCDNVELCAHELVRPGRHRMALVSERPRNLKRSDAHECEPN